MCAADHLHESLKLGEGYEQPIAVVNCTRESVSVVCSGDHRHEHSFINSSLSLSVLHRKSNKMMGFIAGE